MRTTLLLLFVALVASADVGDPQVRTDHPWYPGELAMSTFERLFKTQAELYKRVTGIDPKSDEDKALAALLWRNTHYYHGEEGAQDLWGKGFRSGDLRTREYWTGLFAHGYGLCGTTHSQWSAEMEALLGHARGRAVGVEGHNSFEVWLTGGAYGEGRWALLDHDISTVIFSEDGSRLLSIAEIKADLARLSKREFKPERQRGWLVAGLHPGDAAAYGKYTTAEYLPGYAGPPPSVHLRRGETFRRYLEPGLEDGRTFVYWGRNYKAAGIPGPERSLTWVNQPEKAYKSRDGTPYKQGQARYANAVFTYKPDFAGDYREGVVEEGPDFVTFEFASPYIIAATPPNESEWGIYENGCRNGLVLRGKSDCAVSVSVDHGIKWQECGKFEDGLDLTDRVKGYRGYLIRFGAGPKSLANSGLAMTTVCQMNSSVVPRLKDGGTSVTFEASHRALASTRVLGGNGSIISLTLQVGAPRKGKPVAVYAAAQMASSNPPDAKIKYQIDASTDEGKTWTPVVKDWTVTRRGDEPADFWSQSFCYGSADLASAPGPVQVRFTNTGRKSILRAEEHVLYETSRKDATKVTFDWADDAGPHRESHVYRSAGTWSLKTLKNVKTRWVEFEVSK